MTELKILSESLPQAVVDQESFNTLVEAAREAVSEQKLIDGQAKEVKRAVKFFQDQARPWKDLEASLRARITEYKNAYELAVQEAIEQGYEVPEQFEAEGVSWRKNKKWRVVDADKLPEACFTIVLDEKAVTEMVEAGNVPAGVETYDEFSLVLKL